MIIGLGGIGSEIARKLHYGFNVKVIGVKKNKNTVEEDTFNYVENVIEMDEIKNHASNIDYFIFSLPKIEEGPILNEDFLSRIKKGVVIVNVGRGDAICEKTLYKGLKNEVIKGAALDVFTNEPLDSETVFYTDEEIRPKILN